MQDLPGKFSSASSGNTTSAHPELGNVLSMFSGNNNSGGVIDNSKGLFNR